MTGPTEADVTPDSDAAEEFAEEIGVDPTQDEINHYQRLEGDDPSDDGVKDVEAPPVG